MEFYMLVLALDTTTRTGSVALTRAGVLLDSYSGDARVTHGQRLPGDVIHLLERQNLSVRDVELFAVAAGPGSFTGLRIGIATMQGLALANGRSLIGVSALDALNHALLLPLRPRPSTLQCMVATWMDAQRGEVFSALYDGSTVLDGPSVEPPADVLTRWRAERPSRRITFVGEGACVYVDLIRREMPGAQILVKVPPLAPSVARLAEEHALRQGPSAPDAIRPIYVRRPDAELARDRSLGPSERMGPTDVGPVLPDRPFKQ